MNIQNIDKAIAVMERAEKLNMTRWQTTKSYTFVNSIEELHKCGNTACFAGYIAISEEFKVDGGGVVNAGRPTLNNEYGDKAIAHWLEINKLTANCFIYGKIAVIEDRIVFSEFYNKIWSKVEPSDVIEKLKELKELGEDAFAKKYIL